MSKEFFSLKECAEKAWSYRKWLLIALGITIVGLLVNFEGASTVLRIVLGVFFVLFLPGFFATIAFFPKKGELDEIEIIALSFGLSIAVVPFTVFLLNILVKIPINIWTVSAEILGLIALFWLVYRKQTGRFW